MSQPREWIKNNIHLRPMICAIFKGLNGAGVVDSVTSPLIASLAPTKVRSMLENESELLQTWHVSSTNRGGLRYMIDSQWFGKYDVLHPYQEGQFPTFFILLEWNSTHLQSYLKAMLSHSFSVIRESEGTQMIWIFHTSLHSTLKMASCWSVRWARNGK